MHIGESRAPSAHLEVLVPCSRVLQQCSRGALNPPTTSGLEPRAQKRQHCLIAAPCYSGSSMLWHYTLQPTNRGPRWSILLCRMPIRQEVKTSSSKYTNVVWQRLSGNCCLSRCITSLMQHLNDARNLYGIMEQSVNWKGSLRSLIRIISTDVRAVGQTWEGGLQISSQRNGSEDSSLTQASMRLSFWG